MKNEFKSKSKTIIAIIALALFLILPLIVSAADYYLDKDSIGGPCSDSNPGTSTSTPWCTMHKANQVLTAGDTIYIRQGTYHNGQDPGASIINPVNSGSAGNHITYTHYGDEEVILSFPDTENGNAIYLQDRNYIKVENMKTRKTKSWVNMRASEGKSCSHNIIQNMDFDGEYVGGSPWSGITLGSLKDQGLGTIEYNKIVNNKFTAPCQPADIIYFLFGNCRYNLIEGNDFEGGPHVAIEMQPYKNGAIEFNVIRNNRVRNELHTCINVYGGSNWNLVDNNIILDAGERYSENICGSERDRTAARYVHGGIQLEGSHNIIRRNIMYNCGRMAVEQYGNEGCYNNKFYHNTFYKNYRDWDSVTAESVDGNIAKNNIFWASRERMINHDVQNDNRDNYFINNCMGGDGSLIRWWPDGGGKSIDFMETNHPDLWQGNINSDPAFVDAGNLDFNLQSGSPCIDTGAFLTRTASAGSGASMAVEDARYFTDGWGIIEGDLIQLEDESETARIISIDYDANTLTIDKTLTWSTGQGISLPFSGSKPDIGAFEYDGGSTPPPPPPPEPIPGDIDEDEDIDFDDLILMAVDFGKTSGFNSRADTNNDNEIDIFDIVFVASRI